MKYYTDNLHHVEELTPDEFTKVFGSSFGGSVDTDIRFRDAHVVIDPFENRVNDRTTPLVADSLEALQDVFYASNEKANNFIDQRLVDKNKSQKSEAAVLPGDHVSEVPKTVVGVPADQVLDGNTKGKGKGIPQGK